MLDTGTDQGHIRATYLPTDNRDIQDMKGDWKDDNEHGAGMVLKMTTTATTQILPMTNEGTLDRTEAGGIGEKTSREEEETAK